MIRCSNRKHVGTKSQCRWDEKSQYHMHALSSPKYIEERKDLSMHDRRSSPHYQRKRANISYPGRKFFRRTDTRKTLFCVIAVKAREGLGNIVCELRPEGHFEFASGCAHSHSRSSVVQEGCVLNLATRKIFQRDSEMLREEGIEIDQPKHIEKRSVD